jgi:hypothetical protein
MRVVLVTSLVVLIACGGSKKPADSPSETASPDTSASSSSDMPATSESASPAASPAAAPAASSEAAPAESAPAHPVPNVTGSVDGKPFTPKMARINQPMQKDGRILLTLDERADCGGGDAKQGETILTLMVPWEDGYKQDLGSLKRAGKKGPAEISLVRVGGGGKKDVSATFKPSGRVTIAKAPTELGSLGKMNIDLTSGDYMLSGDLDIQVCVDAKSAQGAPKAAPKSAPTKKKKAM